MKRIYTLFCAVSLLFCFAVNICAAGDFNVSAHSAVLIDADSEKVLWSKDAEERMPMASTTKIMTALVAIENADISSEIAVPRGAVGVEGSSVCLKDGELLTLEELLYAMLLESANDAAAAIAISVGGSIEDFAVMMNQKAEELGLENTSFANPHGLDAENHYTTAHDLAVIAANALKNETFQKIVSTYKYRIPLEKESYRYLMNHNKMLRLYDGAIGVKTGFTKKSGRCLVSAAERDGLRLVAVTLNAPDDWHDHAQMLDYGFENFEMREIAAEGQYSFKLSCVGGTESEITVSNKESIKKCMPKGDGKAEVTVYLPHFLYAPVKAGDEIGKIVLSKNGETLGEVSLNADNGSKVQKYKNKLFCF